MPLVLADAPLFFEGSASTSRSMGPDVIEGTGVTHLRYRVARDATTTAGDASRDGVREVAQAGR